MSARPLRYLALGDSYTIGEGVLASQRWPQRLTEGLRAAGLDMAEPHYVATTGWSSDELAAAIEQQSPPAGQDLVSLLIGVNDQYRGYPAASRRAQIAALLERAIALAGDPRRVLSISIPDWSLTPYAAGSGRDLAAIAAQIDGYNGLLRSLAIETGCAWIDITSCSRAHPQELAADGLHPGPAQYARWSALILPIARARLQAGHDRP